MVKATLDHQILCAAKILKHEYAVNSRDPRAAEFILRFKRECKILQSLRHPNIVQFLHVVQDPHTHQPILLMELMDDNLTHYLQHQDDIPYHVEVNISHDISLAVAFLHKNDIVHRDLSSSNILLNFGFQVKVTDFGMSKVTASEMATCCPGTSNYMPPEAQYYVAEYSKMIDTFSVGVLLLQIATKHPPEPTKRMLPMEGNMMFCVPEVDRRKSDIDQVPSSHGFLPIILKCLEDKPEKRPTADELCESLGQLKRNCRFEVSL